ncbi:MAG TPA: DNA gyrase subunit A [Clostridia bacterium]|nr:DNA gyrase subunit A [Clostridia bacterium]HRU84051.1 DNA gyrase subunit A [Eubacteriales bacterium]
MSKNQDKDREYIEHLSKSNIVKVKVDDEMKKSFIAYAMAVNVSRAIPDVRDGLKPVHRRILYSMSELNLTSDKPYRKCALIVGDVLGKYHPHGDSSVYEALVRMAQDFSIRCPLVDGHGNFGSVDGDPAAAYRYTEAKLSKIASEMIRDIEKNTVDFYPNFDNTKDQPSVLPARFPNLLVNGSDGIAVGMATSIPPHNLGEVIDGTVALIDNPDIEIADLMEYIPAPDYPTAAVVLGRAAIRQAYMTGRGGAVIRARAEIEESPNGRSRIVVTELPYQVNKAKLIETIADQVKDKRLEGISDISEESDRSGMRIVIEIKRDANPNVVLNTLYKQTNMQITNSIILLALVDGVPRILNLKQMLQYYIEHQEQVVIRRTRFDLDKAQEREHIIHGLVIALDNIDAVIETIKASPDRAAAMTNLMEGFALSEKQAAAVLDMRLQRLTGLEVGKLKEELVELEGQIEYFKGILASPEKVRDIIKTELLEIKEKYGTPRRSELSYDYTELNIADLIERQDIVVSLTHLGYIKRMPVSEYRSQNRGGTGMQAHKPKEDDFVESMFITNTHKYILFFTNLGKVYRMMGYEIPEAARTARGRAIVNLLQLAENEKVTAMLRHQENQTGYLMLATKNGKIKKTDLKEFESIRTNGKIAIVLAPDDELVAAAVTAGDEEIILASSSGKCIRFKEEDVRDMGRVAQGVKSIKLKEGESVVDMAVIKEDCEILTVTQNGFGKRTDQNEYRVQGRAGMGILAGRFSEETGGLVCLKVIPPDTDIMLIADNGVMIRIKARDISKIGRATKGVIIMRLKNDSKVICVALTPAEEEDENAENGEAVETAAEETASEESAAPNE